MFQVLIEAVENHMPQVIVIDEIGTKLEAMAASTIAQRGFQLVATAHGITIENLIMNPSLEMLVGGIQVRFTYILSKMPNYFFGISHVIKILYLN
jgi:stage III sporulation protein SpoIIIAA